jgi:hypothetical protein
MDGEVCPKVCQRCFCMVPLTRCHTFSAGGG